MQGLLHGVSCCLQFFSPCVVIMHWQRFVRLIPVSDYAVLLIWWNFSCYWRWRPQRVEGLMLLIWVLCCWFLLKFYWFSRLTSFKKQVVKCAVRAPKL
jgi:hypothetical protein